MEGLRQSQLEFWPASWSFQAKVDEHYSLDGLSGSRSCLELVGLTALVLLASLSVVLPSYLLLRRRDLVFVVYGLERERLQR